MHCKLNSALNPNNDINYWAIPIENDSIHCPAPSLCLDSLMSQLASPPSCTQLTDSPKSYASINPHHQLYYTNSLPPEALTNLSGFLPIHTMLLPIHHPHCSTAPAQPPKARSHKYSGRPFIDGSIVVVVDHQQQHHHQIESGGARLNYNIIM